MIDITKWTHNKIINTPCFAPKCKAETKDWMGDEWFVTGYQVHKDKKEWRDIPISNFTQPCDHHFQTIYARRELETMGVITRSPWAMAYLCPTHKLAAFEALEPMAQL